MISSVISVCSHAFGLAAAMGPYLLLGLAAAGALHAFVPASFIERHLRGESPLAVLKATLLGIPLPLCSCGVLPVAAGLRSRGAGRGPTLSFLITTPVTGVDSLLATYSLMGGVFTLGRLFVSLLLGLLAGMGPGLLARRDPHIAPPLPQDTPREHARPGGRLADALSYGFSELPVSIGSSVLWGLLLGGVLMAWLPPGLVQETLGTGLLGMVAAVALAMPLYVCATGSIPLAAAMMAAGFSPGAALAFLTAGPATNTVAMTTVKKLLGGANLVWYLGVIFAGSVAAGLGLDALLARHELTIPLHHGAGMHASPLATAAGAVVVLLCSLGAARGWVLPRIRHLLARKEPTMNHHSGLVLRVPSMSCMHCVATIQKTLAGLPGVRGVNTDLVAKIVRVDGDVDASQVLSALEQAGYPAVRE